MEIVRDISHFYHIDELDRSELERAIRQLDNNWISVEERLPEEGGKYKTKGFSDAFQNHPFEETGLYFKRSNGTGRFGNDCDWKKVTHWKPEPPEDIV